MRVPSLSRRGAFSVLLVSGLTSGSGLVSCADEAPREPVLQTTEWHIRQGEVNKNDPNVMLLVHDGGNEQGLCSSSLIAPNLLLTARHCVSGTPEEVDCNKAKFKVPYSASSFYASTEYTIPQSYSKYVRVSDVYVPPESASVCGFDMALVVLKANIPADKAVPLIPRLKDDVLKGETYRAVGYGATDAAGSGAGTRRQRQGLKVSCVGEDCSPYSQVNAREWEGDTGICQGDSGGPALDEQNRVIGVVSRGPVNGKVQCDSPTYGSVYKWEDWIVGIAKIAAEKGGYPLPEWAGGPPATVQAGPPPTLPPSDGPPPEIDDSPVYGTPCSEADNTCASGTCITDRGYFYCSHACSSTLACPETYSCTRGGAGAAFCTADVLGKPANSAAASSSGAGCTVAAGPGRDPVKPVPWVVGAVAGLAVLGARRRPRLPAAPRT